MDIERYFESKTAEVPLIAGVVEFLSASDAYLYFKKKTSTGFTRKTPDEEKVKAYSKVFGKTWSELIHGFQYNNGFLIFYKARLLIDQWEEYYLSGLEHDEINPLDDQVPLAAAIQKTACQYWKMDRKWNSLGDLDGQFNMFHAWGGEWKVELDQIFRSGRASSAYGEICARFVNYCPQRWIDDFRLGLGDFPYRYRQIQGAFDHGAIFSELISEMDSGHIVEVGTYKGRSACFVAELIKAAQKPIRFDTIDHYKRSDTSEDLVNQNLKKAEVDKYVKVIASDSLEAVDQYKNEALDFVFLDTDSPAHCLSEELEHWYEKVRHGGILAGYDHTIHDTVFQNYECVVTTFCEKYKLPYHTYEYQFLIRKPNAKQHIL